MCLDYELPEKQADKIKAEARKRGYIRVWKRCHKNPYSGQESTGFWQGKRYKKGIAKASYLIDTNGGWYAFLSKEAASIYAWGNHLVVCYAKPSWIKKLGGEDGIGRAAQFTHLAFPDWHKGDMTIREFREMCRAEK